jgi:RimK-like ATP-grasp domain
MILLCGIPSESPLALVRQRLDQRRVPYVCFSQRQFARMTMYFDVIDGEVTGELTIGEERYPLEYFSGVYTRLMDDQHLPELRGEAADSPARRHCRALHDTLMRWYEIAPIRVVNRTAPMGSNFSKPYQAQLIKAQGFRTPETLITNDPDLVREFHAEHQRIIFKSMSGTRSIVQTMTEEDFGRIDHVRWCPVQFQAFVEGRNVRVHTINGRAFATMIKTEATDYRYAHRQGEDYAELEAIELPDDLGERCLRLAASLDLPFAGIDLKLTPDDEVYCFEVNPSPAYSYYESSTGQPISEALADHLAG